MILGVGAHVILGVAGIIQPIAASYVCHKHKNSIVLPVPGLCFTSETTMSLDLLLTESSLVTSPAVTI
jgi:hypothetical protein